MSNFKAATARTIKLTSHGSSITGIVSSVDTEIQMTFDANNRPNGPRFDANGNVVMGTTITMAIADANGEPTTNVVKLRVGDSIFTDKGKEVSRTTSGLAVAIAEGLAAAGASDLHVGDTITVTYVRDEPVETEGYTPAKVYFVDVTPA